MANSAHRRTSRLRSFGLARLAAHVQIACLCTVLLVTRTFAAPRSKWLQRTDDAKLAMTTASVGTRDCKSSKGGPLNWGQQSSRQPKRSQHANLNWGQERVAGR